MDIQKIKYQYAVPKKYNEQTKSASYEIESEWHEYFSVDVHENYFIEDHLEFLYALKNDLEKELDKVDKDIVDELKVRKRGLK